MDHELNMVNEMIRYIEDEENRESDNSYDDKKKIKLVWEPKNNHSRYEKFTVGPEDMKISAET